MPDPLGINPLDRLAVIARRVALLRGILHGIRRRLRLIKHGRPLLDLLFVVLRRQRAVRAAVPDLHLRPRPLVPGIHVQHDLLPLLRGRARLAAAAGVVPLVDAPRRADEAARRDPRVEGHGADELRVRRGEHVGHHGARRTPRDVDPRRVRAVRLDGVEDHVGDGLGVAAAQVREGLLGRYVPAGPAVRRAWPYRDVPLSVGPLFPWDQVVLEVRLRC